MNINLLLRVLVLTMVQVLGDTKAILVSVSDDVEYGEDNKPIVTVIKANRYRFSYGRKWTLEKMKDTILKLPQAKDGTPDFAYMEDYIKALPYGDRI